jgi:hypothetical protein
VLNGGAGVLYVYANDTWCLPIVVHKDIFFTGSANEAIFLIIYII